MNNGVGNCGVDSNCKNDNDCGDGDYDDDNSDDDNDNGNADDNNDDYECSTGESLMIIIFLNFGNSHAGMT